MVIVTSAVIPIAASVGVSSRTTVTGYETTLDWLPADAVGEIEVTWPVTVWPTAVMARLAAWPISSFGRSLSATLATTWRGLVWISMASPLGATTFGRIATALTMPSAGALSVARSRACWASSTVAWARSTAAWSLAIWAAAVPLTRDA